jgi:cystathionine beta-lyase
MADTKNPGQFTLAAHAGFDPASHNGTVNPPVYHTSTVIFPTVELLERGETKPFEGCATAASARRPARPSNRR